MYRDSPEDRLYKTVIDRLVRDCRRGQGQIGKKRAIAGVWNANATAATPDLRDQYEANLLLARLPRKDRQVIARLLEEAFVGGVHQALVALHEEEVAPFAQAYEGTPFHDFVGRLDGWKWPKGSPRQE